MGSGAGGCGTPKWSPRAHGGPKGRRFLGWTPRPGMVLKEHGVVSKTWVGPPKIELVLKDWSGPQSLAWFPRPELVPKDPGWPPQKDVPRMVPRPGMVPKEGGILDGPQEPGMVSKTWNGPREPGMVPKSLEWSSRTLGGPQELGWSPRAWSGPQDPKMVPKEGGSNGWSPGAWHGPQDLVWSPRHGIVPSDPRWSLGRGAPWVFPRRPR